MSNHLTRTLHLTRDGATRTLCGRAAGPEPEGAINPGNGLRWTLAVEESHGGCGTCQRMARR